jgi:DNA-binding MarR family transcriptional regulator
VPGDTPLPTLLSQVLVAFTIEFDNAFEQQMPHRTSRGGPGGPAPPVSSSGPMKRPWLVSMVMWSNCMQYVEPAGVPVRKLQDRARVGTLGGVLAGMKRWGYVTVSPDPNAGRQKPQAADWLVRPTTAGRWAQQIWRPLTAEIEHHWEARYGLDAMTDLHRSLAPVVEQLDVGLPDYLPVVGYGMRTTDQPRDPSPTPSDDPAPRLGLPTLLSRLLLGFTLEFETNTAISLPISANIMRVLASDEAPVRELPRRSGVSKEAVAGALGFLDRNGDAVVGPSAGDVRGVTARLTTQGHARYDAARRRLGDIETRWTTRFGAARLHHLRDCLGTLVGAGDATSPLFAALHPPAGGWRASLRRPDTLPHAPMVLHRGGFPDGS